MGIHLVFGYFVVGMFRSLGFGAAELYLVISQRCAPSIPFQCDSVHVAEAPPAHSAGLGVLGRKLNHHDFVVSSRRV